MVGELSKNFAKIKCDGFWFLTVTIHFNLVRKKVVVVVVCDVERVWKMGSILGKNGPGLILSERYAKMFEKSD